MLDTRTRRILMTSFLTLIGSVALSGCFLQPVVKVERVFNFVDYNAPAMRLARPVKAYLLVKNASGEWEPIGKGLVPAGAYIKGRAPVGVIE